MGNRAGSRAGASRTSDTNSEDELMAGLAASASSHDDPAATSPGSAGEAKHQNGGAPPRRGGRGRGHRSSRHERDSMDRIEEAAGAADHGGDGILGEDSGTGPSYWSQAKAGYAEAVNAIIRPPRANYTLTELGPPSFELYGLRFERNDFVLRNARGLRIHCSWWQPAAAQRPAEKLPCVIYMHGNSSCRGEAIEVIPMVLTMGCTLLTFDFCGCGMSDGDFISLGWFERDDCDTVIQHLRASGTVTTIGLWGRSMGAATALMHGHRDNTIAAMILDSSFASLEMLVYELYKMANLKYVPRFMVAVALRVVRATILKRCGFDILQLRPVDNVETCFIPAIFIAANEDRFIHPAHSVSIHEKYAGEKNLIRIEGDHNSNRPRFALDSISIFLYQRLCVPTGLTKEFLDAQRQKLGVAPLPPPGSGMSMGGGGSSLRAARRMMQQGQSGVPGVGDDDEDLQRALLASLRMEEEEAGERAGGGGGVGVGNPRGGGGAMMGQPMDVFLRTHAEEVTQLASMGFEPQMAAMRLMQAGGNIEIAAQLLFEGAESSLTSGVGGASSGGGGGGGAGGGRGLAGQLLGAIPRDTRPNAAPTDVFAAGTGSGK